MRIALAMMLLPALAGGASAQPIAPPPVNDNEELHREIAELRAKQRELEQRLLVPPPILDETIPRFHFGRGGFVFGTADGKSEIRLRAVLNLDGRAYVGGAQPPPATFLIRRARPFIDGTLFDIIDYRLMPDFAQGTAAILDAWVELRPWRWLRLRGGRFMVPVGLEWLQKDTTTTFTERSLATALVPYRDLGLMLSGDVGQGIFCYAMAILNGAPDGGNGPDLDSYTGKDYVGRVFLRPLRRIRRAALTDLGLGVAASYGHAQGTALASNLPTYRSTGQQTIFSYSTGAVIADAAVWAAGPRWRFTPQLYWYIGPLGVIAEYVVSSQRVQRTGFSADIQNRAWNLTASIVLTMERAAYDGVTPKHPVDFRHRYFGALELTARYTELRIDDKAFPNFADPAKSVRAARELAGGVNWYLTDYIKIMMSYHRTEFVGGAAAGGNRDPENAIMGRLQLAL